MRSFLNKYGIYVAVVAIVAAAILWFVLHRTTHVPSSTFFIDEDTGQESLRPVTDVPPLVGAKGNLSVVKVYKYIWPGHSTPKVAYYIKYTPEMQRKLEEAAKHPDVSVDLKAETGMLVRTPESGPSGWVAATSAEGDKIMVGDLSEGPRETVYP